MTHPSDLLHPMSVVVRRTGLSAAVIRAWERRYGAVEPRRSDGNRRLFSDADVERLQLLRDVLDRGWQIGQVAQLEEAELRLLARDDAAAPGAIDERARRRVDRGRAGRASELFDDALAAIGDLDGLRLAAALEKAGVELSRTRLMDDFLVPLMERVGDEVGDGGLRAANEHLATAVVRAHVEGLSSAFGVDEAAPSLVVTTPAFQHHELGAVLAAATGRIEGWCTTYLGPNLPAEDIAAAVQARDARAVALSISWPGDDLRLDEELRKLGRLVPRDVAILVGGRSSSAYADALDDIGARQLPDLSGLRSALHALRDGRAVTRAGVRITPS